MADPKSSPSLPEEEMAMRNTDGDTASRGVLPAPYLQVNGTEPELVQGEVVEETLACISVNGKELATFMCTPTRLDHLAAGFLLNEGLIHHKDDIASIHISDNDCIDVWLHHEIDIPKRKIITAGCGGGVTFDDMSETHPPLTSARTFPATRLPGLMKDLQIGAEIYLRSRGIHSAALADESGILLQVEDIGRHNCIDKIAGAALFNHIDTSDRILISSGRISSEMLNKARRMRIPIVCSRTSPTSLSVALASAWNMTIVAYLRGNRMRIYAHPERIFPSTDLPG